MFRCAGSKFELITVRRQYTISMPILLPAHTNQFGMGQSKTEKFLKRNHLIEKFKILPTAAQSNYADCRSIDNYVSHYMCLASVLFWVHFELEFAQQQNEITFKLLDIGQYL